MPRQSTQPTKSEMRATNGFAILISIRPHVTLLPAAATAIKGVRGRDRRVRRRGAWWADSPGQERGRRVAYDDQGLVGLGFRRSPSGTQ